MRGLILALLLFSKEARADYLLDVMNFYDQNKDESGYIPEDGYNEDMEPEHYSWKLLEDEEMIIIYEDKCP